MISFFHGWRKRKIHIKLYILSTSKYDQIEYWDIISIKNILTNHNFHNDTMKEILCFMTLPFRYLQMSSMTVFVEKITITVDLALNGTTCVLAWLLQPTPGFLSWSADAGSWKNFVHLLINHVTNVVPVCLLYACVCLCACFKICKTCNSRLQLLWKSTNT